MHFRVDDLLHWISALNPCIQSAEERTHTRDASLLELQRHPGTGRFVGSSTVQDDVAITRNFNVTIFELLGRQPQCPRDLHRFHIQPCLIA